MTSDVTDNRCATCFGTRVQRIVDFEGTPVDDRPCPYCAPAAKEPVMRRWTPCSHDMWLATDPEQVAASALYVLASDHDSAVAALSAQVEALTVELRKTGDDYRCARDSADKAIAKRDKLTAENAAQRRQLNALANFDPVWLGMLHTAADNCAPIYRGVILRAYELLASKAGV